MFTAPDKLGIKKLSKRNHRKQLVRNICVPTVYSTHFENNRSVRFRHQRRREHCVASKRRKHLQITSRGVYLLGVRCRVEIVLCYVKRDILMVTETPRVPEKWEGINSKGK
ncbi:hypothetical protein EVAR_44105_1 [Eumeta japonica]|uniref:Uncharacterized protein n=1 Tax=Eumeta variegata TaxID=151549 RepID=A0A4C1X4R2_EUMVA|nr:hypothetical protein EVAR_44105_1 [Eumeta japonica]